MAQPLDSYRFAIFLASHMDKKARANNNKTGRATVFDSEVRTKLKLKIFLMCIFVNARYSLRCYLLAYIYINRYCSIHGLLVQSRNIHGLLLASLCVAAKASQEECCNNKSLASIADITVKDLNAMEATFIDGLAFLPRCYTGLYVTQSDFHFYCNELQAEIDKEGLLPPKIYNLLYGGDTATECGDVASSDSSNSS